MHVMHCSDCQAQRLNPQARAVTTEIIGRLQRSGHVAKVNSAWTSPPPAAAALISRDHKSGLIVAGIIGDASDQQASGAQQVNSAMGAIDRITQGNAANAEESASASEELSAQAVEMNDFVNQLAGLVNGSDGSQPQGRRPVAAATPATK